MSSSLSPCSDVETCSFQRSLTSLCLPCQAHVVGCLIVMIDSEFILEAAQVKVVVTIVRTATVEGQQRSRGVLERYYYLHLIQSCLALSTPRASLPVTKGVSSQNPSVSPSPASRLLLSPTRNCPSLGLEPTGNSSLLPGPRHIPMPSDYLNNTRTAYTGADLCVT